LYDGANLLAAFASSGNSNTGDTTLSLPRQDTGDGSSTAPGASGASAGAANSAGSATGSNEKYGEPKTPRPESSNAATTAATTPSARPRNPGGVGRIVAGDAAPVVYTRLDGTLATSAPPVKVTNVTAGEGPRGEETILTPGNPLVEFAQWLTRQSARYTYWLLFLLLAVIITFEIIRRRSRRKQKVSIEE
jgi:hypothetical protein